jgi:RNA polymerase Rpb2, domain 4.
MIHPHTSIYIRDGHLFVMTDAGRALRPLIPVDVETGRPALTKEIVAELVARRMNFDELFLDPEGERDAVME